MRALAIGLAVDVSGTGVVVVVVGGLVVDVATVVGATVVGAAVVGGGAVVIPVFDNGAAWIVG